MGLRIVELVDKRIDTSPQSWTRRSERRLSVFVVVAQVCKRESTKQLINALFVMTLT